MTFKYQFDPGTPEEKYIKFQHHLALGKDPQKQAALMFNVQENIDIILKALDKPPRRVVDLGCGLGRMSLALQQIAYPNEDIFFYLADSTMKPGDKPCVGWLSNGNPKSNSYYNDLNLTAKIANEAGLKFQTIDIREEGFNQIENVDLVMSFQAVGHHFPIPPYVDALRDKVTEDCTWIFGNSKDRYDPSKKGKNTLDKLFEEVTLFKTRGIDGRRTEMIVVCRRVINPHH